LELFPENKKLKEYYNIAEIKKMNKERNQNINIKNNFKAMVN
jgi:hypothetical protein